MHPEDIKAAIRKKGATQRSIATSLNVSSMAVAHIITGRQKSARVARAIASVTGLRVAELFPGKYPKLEFLEGTGLTSASASAAKAEVELRASMTLRAPRKSTKRGAAA